MTNQQSEEMQSMARFDAVFELRIKNETEQSAWPTPEQRSANADRFFRLFLGSDARLTPEMRALAGFYGYLLRAGAAEWPGRGYDGEADPWGSLLAQLHGGGEPAVWEFREYVVWAALGAYRWNPYRRQPAFLIQDSWEWVIRAQLGEMLGELFVPHTTESRMFGKLEQPVRSNHNDRVRLGHIATFVGTDDAPGDKSMIHSGIITHQMLEPTADGGRITRTTVVPSMCTTFALAPCSYQPTPATCARYAILKIPTAVLVGLPLGGWQPDDRPIGQRSRILQLLCYLVENLIKVHALEDVVVGPKVLEDVPGIDRYLGICRTVAIAKAVNANYMTTRAWDPLSLLKIQPHLVITDDVVKYVDHLHRAVVATI